MNGSLRSPQVRLMVAIAILAVVAVAAAGFRGTPARAAQTLNVTSTVDSNNGTLYACPATLILPCTLRLAIETANSDSDGDVINVPAGTYQLTTATNLHIAAGQTVVGADPRTTVIDGDGGTALLVIDDGVDTDVHISNLTFQNGANANSGGGAILNESAAKVFFDNVSINDNTFQERAGAVSGGGIYNAASDDLVVTNSLIADNHAPHGGDTGSSSLGGGIYNNGGTVLLTNVTMTGNSTDEGGAIYSTNGEVTLVNDTIAGNAGGSRNTGDGAVRGNVIVPLGGGVVDVAATSVHLKNTIVAANTNGDCRSQGGDFVTDGHNIDSDGTCQLDTAQQDQPGADPAVKPLTLNAPGQTRTMAIDSSSPAYNTGVATGAPATDQRGVTRPQGGLFDIGAYELVVVALAAAPAPAPGLPAAGAGRASWGLPWPAVTVGMLGAFVLVLLAAVAVLTRRAE